MRDESRFWDRISAKYARDPIKDMEAYERKLEVTRGYLKPDMEVLEFGCGTGGTALLHARHVAQIHAIDISTKMIDIARGKAAEARISNVKFYVASIDDFVAPEDGYDVIMGMSILHLVNDRDAVIAKVHQMLKPGGVFISSTVCMGDFVRWMRLVGPIGHAIRLLPLLRVFTGDELKTSLTGAGFEIDHEWRPGKDKAAFFVAKKVQ